MASYPDGTVFNSAQTFPSNTQFGAGCIFADGCVFQNPCTFGDACVFGKGCQLLWIHNRRPPHTTGAGCVFAPGCAIIYTNIGAANIIQEPSQFQPNSVGSDVIQGNSNHTTWPKAVESSNCGKCGQVVSGEKASNDWCEAQKITGFDAPNATVKHKDYCEG